MKSKIKKIKKKNMQDQIQCIRLSLIILASPRGTRINPGRDK